MHTPLRCVDRVATSLPFAVDDYAAAGASFARWRTGGARRDFDLVMSWIYCYVRRYFHVQLARDRVGGASDVEEAFDRTYNRVLGALHSVRQPDKFPHFVSVVCRNGLRDHRARRPRTVDVEDVALEEPARPPGALDREWTHEAIARSIGALPPSVAEVARMRLLDDMGYEAIAEATGHPTPTVHTYVSKAKARLRNDPALRALFFGDAWPPDSLRSAA